MDTCSEGHYWTPSLEFTPKSGVMPVHCTECGEIGFHFAIEEKVHG